MAKIMLSIECEPDEYQPILRRLIGHLEDFPVAVAGPDEAHQAEGDERWNRDELLQLWKGSRPEAQALLAEIAKRPRGYTFEDLQSAFQLDGLTVGGQLSSVGHAKRRLFPAKPDPVRRDYRTRTYTMDPDVAEVFRELGE